MAEKDRKTGWKIGSVVIVIVFGCMIWGIVSLFWMGGTEKIEAVANQFTPEKDWVLVQEEIVAPRSFCGDVTCPSVYRQWDTGHTLSKQELTTLLQKAGWDTTVDGDCVLDSKDSSEKVTVCSTESVVNNAYRIYVSVSVLKSSQKPQVSLRVEKE